MPRFEVRLEAQDSDEFRITRLEADDAAAAQHICEHFEAKRVAYEMPAEQLAEALEVEADPDQTLAGEMKGRLFTHRQAAPYLVVSVEEV